MNRDIHRVKVEFEENSRGTLVVVNDASIMRDTVLVGVKRITSRSDIGCRNDMQEVLIGSEVWFAPVSPTFGINATQK